MYEAPWKYSTGVLVLPMSAIVFQVGCAAGDHWMICGLISRPAMTATVGCVADSAICSSVPR